MESGFDQNTTETNPFQTFPILTVAQFTEDCFSNMRNRRKCHFKLLYRMNISKEASSFFMSHLRE